MIFQFWTCKFSMRKKIRTLLGDRRMNLPYHTLFLKNLLLLTDPIKPILPFSCKKIIFFFSGCWLPVLLQDHGDTWWQDYDMIYNAQLQDMIFLLHSNISWKKSCHVFLKVPKK